MKSYRGWVYKIVFFIFGQLVAMLGLILSGDIFYKEGNEFNITIEEIKEVELKIS